MFHCISDQTQYNSHLEVRNYVVSNIYRMIDENMIFLDNSELIIDYIERMELDGTFGDQYALQVIANVMERDILIIPSKAESVQNVVQQKQKQQRQHYLHPILMLWLNLAIYVKMQ